MISFLHTADWQIGRVFAQFEPDDAAALFEARFKAVERLAALATERNVDAVLVAGDVFDAQTIADKTVRRLFNALQGFAGPWLLLPGNHDAALSESIWTRAHRLGAVPANVTCCLAPRPHSVAGKFTVLPAPLTQRHSYEDLTAWFDTAPSPEGQPRIGLAHGCVQGILADGIDSANPIAPERAQQARLDYLALGDWHGTRRIDGRTWYAGTPETDRFKANDSGQALLVTLGGVGAQPDVQPLHTGQFCWQQLEPVLAVASDMDALLAQLGALDAHDVLQLRPRGHCDLAGHRQLLAALDAARARTRALVWNGDALRLAPTQDDLDALQADGFVGEVLQALRAEQTQAQAGAGSAADGADGQGTQDSGARRARDALLALARILDAQRAHQPGTAPAGANA